MSNLFEKATRKKLRFDIPQGFCSVEDLWDCSLKTLNSLAIKLNKLVKESEEEDFLKEVPRPVTTSKTEFDIVLYILNVKKEEKLARITAKEKKANKEKLLSALARKEDEAIDNMTEAEIKKAIDEI